MKKYDHLREKAIYFRTKKKMTLTEICKRLHVPKTTAYYWIAKFPIEYRKLPRTKKQVQATLKMVSATKKRWGIKRQAAYNEGKQLAPELFTDSLFRDFVSIYLCEGYRKSRNTVAVTNSNINIIAISYKYMQIFRHPDRKFDYWVQIHKDQNIDAVLDHWSKALDNLKHRNWACKYGVLAVRVHDTYFRSKLQAWMDYMQEQWKLEVSSGRLIG